MPCCSKPKSKNQIERNFTPEYRTRFLTEKFYARHDQLTIRPEHQHRVQMYEREIAKRRGPHDIKTSAPRTENQEYGWLAELGLQYDTTDKRIQNHHHVPDAVLKNYINIAYEIRRYPFLYR